MSLAFPFWCCASRDDLGKGFSCCFFLLVPESFVSQELSVWIAFLVLDTEYASFHSAKMCLFLLSLSVDPHWGQCCFQLSGNIVCWSLIKEEKNIFITLGRRWAVFQQISLCVFAKSAMYFSSHPCSLRALRCQGLNILFFNSLRAIFKWNWILLSEK